MQTLLRGSDLGVWSSGLRSSMDCILDPEVPADALVQPCDLHPAASVLRSGN